VLLFDDINSGASEEHGRGWKGVDGQLVLSVTGEPIPGDGPAERKEARRKKVIRINPHQLQVVNISAGEKRSRRKGD
jgi:hypothetical protein